MLKFLIAMTSLMFLGSAMADNIQSTIQFECVNLVKVSNKGTGLNIVYTGDITMLQLKSGSNGRAYYELAGGLNFFNNYKYILFSPNSKTSGSLIFRNRDEPKWLQSIEISDINLLSKTLKMSVNVNDGGYPGIFERKNCVIKN